MRIDERFTGPPGSGNGGYSAGVFAAAAGATVGGATVAVTLRRPPPLGVALTLAGGAVHDPEGALIAEVAQVAAATEPVSAVSAARAAAAVPGYAGFAHHPFPGCWVCGPDRADGLRIFPGPVAAGRTAAPWTVPAEVDLPVVWAALDCTGGWTVIGPGGTYVLGRLTATVAALPRPGATCVVVGAADAVEGRKAQVRSTVYGPDGAPLATARAVWIMVSG